MIARATGDIVVMLHIDDAELTHFDFARNRARRSCDQLAVASHQHCVVVAHKARAAIDKTKSQIRFS